MAKVRIRPGHVRPLWAGHPWVYAQAVAGVEGSPEAGDVVTVLDPQGNFLGSGFYSPKSALAVRILSRTEGEALDREFFTRRIAAAHRLRREWLGLPNAQTTGYRLVHAEGDGLSGLVVDIFADVAVVQVLTAGMKKREADVFAALAEVTGVRSIVTLPSDDHQDNEGFRVAGGVVHGPSVDALAFRELGFEYTLPLSAAQKTGFYFDQRDNRARVETLCKGRSVLDACCYMGSFALAAARGGASSVLALDRSEAALEAGRAHAQVAGYAERITFERADMKKALPDMIVQGKRFDVVVLDPPKLAQSVRHLERARKAYRHWNAQAVRLVEPGGLLVSCSCSAAMQAHDFVRTLAVAAADAGRSVDLLVLGEQGQDHPTPAAFDEGRYLKAAFLRVS